MQITLPEKWIQVVRAHFQALADLEGAAGNEQDWVEFTTFVDVLDNAVYDAAHNAGQ
jgi:hypothetical protein